MLGLNCTYHGVHKYDILNTQNQLRYFFHNMALKKDFNPNLYLQQPKLVKISMFNGYSLPRNHPFNHYLIPLGNSFDNSCSFFMQGTHSEFVNKIKSHWLSNMDFFKEEEIQYLTNSIVITENNSFLVNDVITGDYNFFDDPENKKNFKNCVNIFLDSRDLTKKVYIRDTEIFYKGEKFFKNGIIKKKINFLF